MNYPLCRFGLGFPFDKVFTCGATAALMYLVGAGRGIFGIDEVLGAVVVPLDPPPFGAVLFDFRGMNKNTKIY